MVAAAVLGSAVIHASWNAVAKAIPDRLVASTLLGAGFALLGGLWVTVAPAPLAASWPYLGGSALLQTGYLLLLTAAYANGEFRQIYPLARGTAPLLVSLFAIGVLGERLTSWQLVGIALVVAALGVLVAIPRGPGGRGPCGRGPLSAGSASHRRGVLLAIATGVVIAGYTVVDGIGVRQSGTAAGYAAWQMVVHGPILIATCVALAGPRRLTRALRVGGARLVALGVAGGAASMIAYAIVLWAQDRASLALVSALRETSVLFAGVIGTLVFKERFSGRQMLAAGAVVVGIVLMQLG